MKYYTAKEIILIDGTTISEPQAFCFMTGETQGFIAVTSDSTSKNTQHDDIPVDIISTSQIKRIIGATALNKPSTGQVKYCGGYKF